MAEKKLLFCDIETYCELDLRKVGVYRYAAHPSFKILMAAYATEDDVMLGRVNVVTEEDDIRGIPGLWDDDVMIVAHNAAFERICFSRFAGMGDGEFLSVGRFDDTMPLAGEWGYPQSLKSLAIALGAEKKDDAGTRLINLFSKPNRKGERTLPEEKPDQWKEFVEYCRQDVATLIDIYERIPTWPAGSREREMWECDQRINDRGILIDREMAENAVAAAEENQELQKQEVIDLTGVENPTSISQLIDWIRFQGVNIPSLMKSEVEIYLDEA